MSWSDIVTHTHALLPKAKSTLDALQELFPLQTDGMTVESENEDNRYERYMKIREWLGQADEMGLISTDEKNNIRAQINTCFRLEAMEVEPVPSFQQKRD